MTDVENLNLAACTYAHIYEVKKCPIASGFESDME